MAVTAFNLGGTKYRTHLSGNVGSNYELQMTIPNNYNYIVCVWQRTTIRNKRTLT